MKLSRLYTRIIGVAFVLVALSLASDLQQFGFRPETLHKVFHVLLGVAIIGWGWRSAGWWRTFPVVNGAFFSYVALFGWLFPDFAGLDAFNRLDTVLHSIVGLSGLVVAFLDRRA